MINFIDISKTFNMKKQQTHALDHVSLQVQDGDIFGVIGFSGAGKSTLLRMVNGLETPTGGRMEVDGQDINKIGRASCRERV
jgi:D-methionine transport system ATP-binding protein